nr:PREDICTED: hepatitis A virus cellular receptor 2 homolog isoform X2 [Lepisosteus oculatus]
MRLCRILPSCCLVMSLMAVTGVSALTVRGSVGQNVTLPCRYTVRDLGVTTMCWGRGELPLSWCNNMIISTDGQSVNSRLSERYQLLGQLTRGDVSLTILHAQESDSGLYSCRVKVPGLFNDQKHTVNLIVTKAPYTTAATEATVSASTEQPWDRSTGHTTGRQHNYTQGGAVRTGTHPPHVPDEVLIANGVRLLCVVCLTGAFLSALLFRCIKR